MSNLFNTEFSEIQLVVNSNKKLKVKKPTYKFLVLIGVLQCAFTIIAPSKQQDAWQQI